MDSILKLIVKHDKFKYFRLIYSIKDLLLKHNPGSIPCRMCFIGIGPGWWIINKPIENQLKFINRYGNEYTGHDLCLSCIAMRPGITYKNYTERILVLIYQHERDKFKEIANLFEVAEPYQMLLGEYGSLYLSKKEIISVMMDMMPTLL